MLGNEPDGFVRRHPIRTIKARQVYRARVAAECPFKTQIEIDIEVTHGQLAQRAINRLAITAAGKVRFCHRAPMSAHLENRNHMVGVLFRFQVENQWRKTEDAERGGAKDSAFQAGSGAGMKHRSWRMRSEIQIVWKFVEKSLNTGRSF